MLAMQATGIVLEVAIAGAESMVRQDGADLLRIGHKQHGALRREPLAQKQFHDVFLVESARA